MGFSRFWLLMRPDGEAPITAYIPNPRRADPWDWSPAVRRCGGGQSPSPAPPPYVFGCHVILTANAPPPYVFSASHIASTSSTSSSVARLTVITRSSNWITKSSFAGYFLYWLQTHSTALRLPNR